MKKLIIVLTLLLLFTGRALANEGDTGVVFSPNWLVYAVFLQSPADVNGIKPGDVVTSINGKSTKGHSPDELANEYTGDAGKSINLQVNSGGQVRPLTLSLAHLESFSSVYVAGNKNKSLDSLLGVLTYDDGSEGQDVVQIKELKKSHSRSVPIIKLVHTKYSNVVPKVDFGGQNMLDNLLDVVSSDYTKGVVQVQSDGGCNDAEMRNIADNSSMLDEKLTKLLKGGWQQYSLDITFNVKPGDKNYSLLEIDTDIKGFWSSDLTGRNFWEDLKSSGTLEKNIISGMAKSSN